MFRYTRDPLFVTCTLLYAANRWIMKPQLPAGEVFFRCYFNDLLLIPCALPVMLLVHRCLALRSHDDSPTAREIGLHLVVWSLYCEGIGPLIQNQGVQDIVDVLAYWIGGVVSWGLWNRAAILIDDRNLHVADRRLRA